MMEIRLTDERIILLPLSFFPTLESASSRDRKDWKLLGRGMGVCWERLDLQVAVEDMLAGRREHIPPADFKMWLSKRQTIESNKTAPKPKTRRAG